MSTNAEVPIANDAVSSGEGIDPNVVDVDVVQLRLPCRAYRINYKVAETGDFTLTTEFLLRFLRLIDGLPETAISDFFGFTAGETQFIVDTVENRGFTERKKGRVYLTAGGHSQFLGSEELSLFEVSSKEERFDFDLLSFSPADQRRNLDSFENKLPELSVSSSADGQNTSDRVGKAFKRFFQEFLVKRGGAKIDRRKLYTVDAVHADVRFSVIVPVTLSVRVDEPGFPEANLLEWRTGAELEDRASVVESCATFAKEIRFHTDQVSSEAVSFLQKFAPEQLAAFLKSDRLNAEQFFKVTARQAGELRSNRTAVKTLGQLWTNANRIRFALALKYSMEQSTVKPALLVWVKPSVPHWGSTTRIATILSAVERQFTNGDDTDVSKLKTILIGTGDKGATSAFKHVFRGVVHTSLSDLPGGLEVLIIPDHFAYVAVHTPVGQAEGYPIPLGVMTFDVKAVRRAQRLLARVLETIHPSQVHCEWGSEDIIGDLHTLLLESPSPNPKVEGG
jgi:hypothetical protein